MGQGQMQRQGLQPLTPPPGLRLAVRTTAAHSECRMGVVQPLCMQLCLYRESSVSSPGTSVHMCMGHADNTGHISMHENSIPSAGMHLRSVLMTWGATPPSPSHQSPRRHKPPCQLARTPLLPVQTGPCTSHQPVPSQCGHSRRK